MAKIYKDKCGSWYGPDVYLTLSPQQFNGKSAINYFKNLQEHLTNNISQKKLILVQGTDSLLRITNTSSSNNEDTNFIMNQNQNEMLYKMSRSFSKLLKYVQRNPNNFIIISFNHICLFFYCIYTLYVVEVPSANSTTISTVLLGMVGLSVKSL